MTQISNFRQNEQQILIINKSTSKQTFLHGKNFIKSQNQVPKWNKSIQNQRKYNLLYKELFKINRYINPPKENCSNNSYN